METLYLDLPINISETSGMLDFSLPLQLIYVTDNTYTYSSGVGCRILCR